MIDTVSQKPIFQSNTPWRLICCTILTENRQHRFLISISLNFRSRKCSFSEIRFERIVENHTPEKRKWPIESAARMIVGIECTYENCYIFTKFWKIQNILKCIIYHIIVSCTPELRYLAPSPFPDTRASK